MLLLLGCSDYGLEKTADHAGRRRHEESAPEVDSGATDTGGGGTGTTAETDACSAGRTVRLGLAADDLWTAWIDGADLGSAEHWWESAWTEVTLDCGEHVLAVYGEDLHQAISGFIAAVEVDGELVSVSGDAAWRVIAGMGDRGWRDPGFDDAAWGTGVPCEESSALGWWGGSPADLRALGAWWIWSGECLDLGTASFRMTFVVE